MKLPSLCIAAPAYNEEANAPRFVAAFVDVAWSMLANGQIKEFQILLVNDGSSDGTGPLLDDLSRKDSHVKVVHHPENRGYAAAYKTALAEADGDWVLLTDADLPFDPALLPRLLNEALDQKVDLLATYRLGRWATGKRRAIMSGVYQALVRLKFRLPYRDVNFACKLVSRPVLQAVLPLQSDSLFIDPELLFKTKKAGFRIGQFPVPYLEREHGVSTLGNWANVRATLRDWWQISGR